MPEPLKWIFCASGCLLVTGLILIVVVFRIMHRRENRRMRYTAQILLPEIRKTMLQTMEQSMDLIPGKIAEAKKVLEE